LTLRLIVTLFGDIVWRHCLATFPSVSLHDTKLKKKEKKNYFNVKWLSNSGSDGSFSFNDINPVSL